MMSKQFPKINNCILCEEVRVEMKGKSSILGFYGLTPSATILVQDFGKPIQRLAFMLLADAGSGGDYNVALKILDENKNSIVDSKKKSGDLPVSIPNSEKTNTLALGLGPIQFTEPGTYTFIFFVEGVEHYSTTFQVDRGEPIDFLR